MMSSERNAAPRRPGWMAEARAAPDPVCHRSGSIVARAPAVAERLQRDGVEPVGGTPAQMGALIAREIPQWRDLAKAANIKLQ